MPSSPSPVTVQAGPTATRQDVSRLFARAAFGATAADLDAWEGVPYADIVDHLLDVPPLDARPPQPDEPRRLLLEQARYTELPRPLNALAGSIEEAGRWWLERMRTSPYPLEERMALFWHDHFATGYLFPYPDVGMILIQNQTLRRHALGSFRSLVEAITVDPAMLYWLNGAMSTRGAPNENYARELFELFTLGTIPQVYTEQDVRESARALTGWVVDPDTRQPSFQANRHDAGTKQVLGRTIGNLGAAEYKEIVDVALDQEASPLFVAYKMVLSFAYVPVTGDLMQDPDPLVTKVAQTLRTSDWDLKAATRTLLLADEFRDADVSVGKQVVRQPVDLVVSACKAIGVTADTAEATAPLRRMGQVLFDPPNVGGWPNGKEWISPVTTLARYDWGVTCYNVWAAANATLRPALPASGDLPGWARRFGLAGFTPNTDQSIRDYLAARATAAEAERQAGVLILIASSPDWMVM